MDKMVMNAEISERLRNALGQVELYDEAGMLIGHFIPEIDRSFYATVEIPIADEELRRRAEKGGGRTLAEIMADLERRS
jgi:hypothetical protein